MLRTASFAVCLLRPEDATFGSSAPVTAVVLE